MIKVETRLVEVRDARPILASLGDLLVGPAGDALAGALRQDLFPTEAERPHEVTDRIAALGALQSALANYEAALTARDPAPAQARNAGPAALAVATARQDAAAEAAELAVQLAARRAGRPSPL